MIPRAPGCGEVRGDLGFLLLPGHAPDRAAVLRDHLAGCTACREIFAEVRRNFTTLRQAPAPEPGPDFSAEIMDRLPRRVPRRRRRARLALLPLVAVAGLVPGLGTLAAFGIPGLASPGLGGISTWASEAVASLVRLVGSALASAITGGPAARLDAPAFALGGSLRASLLLAALTGLLLAGSLTVALLARRRTSR
jgi:predicted anti-sigma-YlaC factor YlaD